MIKKTEDKDDQVICDVCNKGTSQVTWCNLPNTQGCQSDHIWVCDKCMKNDGYKAYGWSPHLIDGEKENNNEYYIQ